MDSDLQRSYQLNMLIGQIVATGAAALFAVWVKVYDAQTPALTHPPIRTRELMQEVYGFAGGRGHSASAGFNGGFIDRGRLHIVPDGPAVIPQVTPVLYTFQTDIDSIIVDDFFGLGEGTGSGIGSGCDDFGLPEVPRLFTKMPMQIPDFSESKLVINPPKPNRPLTIVNFTAPFPPPKVRNLNGIATVKLSIDQRGRVTSIAIVHENPENVGLGQALREALNNCYYEPAIVNGQEVGMEVTVTYEFSLNAKTSLRTSGNVNFVMR